MNVPKKRKKYLLKKKKCQFDGCDKEYTGNNVSKYCRIHRQTKYKKELYRKKKPKDESANQIIKHDYMNDPIVSFKCALEGCNTVFNIQLFHNLYIYPKYCEEHRSEWKRDYFTKQHKKE